MHHNFGHEVSPARFGIDASCPRFKSKAQRTAVDSAKAQLAAPLALFVMPKSAGCSVKEANVKIGGDEPKQAQAALRIPLARLWGSSRGAASDGNRSGRAHRHATELGCKGLIQRCIVAQILGT